MSSGHMHSSLQVCQSMTSVRQDCVSIRLPAGLLRLKRTFAEAAAPSEVKNALDPDQGNIVSAYSADQGRGLAVQHAPIVVEI